jgi:hypothetical protein
MMSLFTSIQPCSAPTLTSRNILTHNRYSQPEPGDAAQADSVIDRYAYVIFTSVHADGGRSWFERTGQ